MISTADLIIFFRIFLAHILADFFLQRYSWVLGKRSGVKSIFLYYHIAIVGLLTYFFLADWTNWQLPLFIAITHYFIDWWKSTRPNSARYFIIDQGLHITMLVIAWLWYIGYGFGDINNLWSSMNSSSLWIITGAYLLVLRPLGFLIDKLTLRWKNELTKYTTKLAGLKYAGTYIGYVERTIILTFILIGQYSAIGFLIAAKSILRYNGKTSGDEDKMQAEYILIGTLLSFLFAILIGLGTVYFLSF